MTGIIAEDLLAIRRRLTGWDRLKGKTVLIAGAGSLIGGTTALSLLEANRALDLRLSVVCLVRTLSRAKKWFADFAGDESLTLVETDLSQPLDYDGVADIIIHSGGSSSPWAYANDPVGILKANVTGGLNLLDLARKRNTESFLFFSSREIYGNPGDSKCIGEADLGIINHLQLRNVYPESKKMTESALVAFGAQYGVPWIILRIASVYGPGMKLAEDGRAISDFVQAAVQQADIRLNSDGRAVRSYCYISDAVAGILTVLLSGQQNRVFNLANETQQFSIRETAEAALDVGGGGQIFLGGDAASGKPDGDGNDGAGRGAERREPGEAGRSDAGSGGGDDGGTGAEKREPGEAVRSGAGSGDGNDGGTGDERARGSGAPQYSTFTYVPMDVSALESLGWRPQVSLKEGLERTIAYFRS